MHTKAVEPDRMSEIRFPMAIPQAAAGPNWMPKTSGTMLAGRISVTPGRRVSRLRKGSVMAKNTTALSSICPHALFFRNTVNISFILLCPFRRPGHSTTILSNTTVLSWISILR